MNSTIAKLADEFEKMEKTIASQKKMIETLMPTGYPVPRAKLQKAVYHLPESGVQVH